MSFRAVRGYLLGTAVLASLAASVTLPLNAQAVISARSGVIHFFEGSVYLNDQLLENRLGRFGFVDQGAELRTEQGRAEVLLTPGVILRLDQDTAIRMVSNSLADTEVELLKGSAMVDSAVPEDGTSVTVSYKGWKVRFPEKGIYRIDSAPPKVWARDGVAQVTDATENPPVAVGAGTDLPLSAALVPEETTDEPLDALYNWDRGREDSISADNQIAANIQDPGSLPDASIDPGDLADSGFTQFPMIGLAPVSPVTPYGAYGPSMYSSIYPYQPGFYSLYLPGYTYYPSLFLTIPPNLLRSTIYGPRNGISSITVPRPLTFGGTRPISAPGRLSPGSPVSRPAPMVRPSAPVARPAAPHVGGFHK